MKFVSLILAAVLVTAHLAALPSIEITKDKALKALQAKNPAVVKEFHGLYAEYETLLTDFFDTENNEPLKVHITKIEKTAEQLQKVIEDPRFSAIQEMITPYHRKAKKLIKILLSYVDSGTAIGLAFKLRNFLFLLPSEVNDRGYWSLLDSLGHRLNC